MMRSRITRREFLRQSALAGAGAALASGAMATTVFGGPRPAPYEPKVDLAIATGPSPGENALAAVDALGGFRKFVGKGDRVVIKPNPLGNAPPEMGICTHPEIIEAVVRACYEAGAGEVVAVSNDDWMHVEASGTVAAVERGGGTFRLLDKESMFREVVVPRGSLLRRNKVAVDVLDADVFINLPIAKHHVDTRATFSMKNLMGVVWDRLYYHRTDLERCIAEAVTAIDHSLIVMDANHVLLSNGPMGPGRVQHAQKVIAGVDPVAVDACGTQFFRVKPQDVRHIRLAYELGVGEIDLTMLNIRETRV